MFKRYDIREIGNEWCQIEIELRDKECGLELSICGVYGDGSPGEMFVCCDGKRRRANSFGQIRDELARFYPEAEPFFKWHLNGMNAGCIHQDAWDTTEPIEIVTYRLTSEAINERYELKRAIDKELQQTGKVDLTEEQRAFLRLSFSTTEAPDADSPASGRYEVSKRETKTAGWVRHTEHPRGLLMKPCPECGYEYGSAWTFRALPAEVIEWAKGGE